LDRNGAGTIDVNFSIRGGIGFNCDFMGTPDYSLEEQLATSTSHADSVLTETPSLSST
jgi:hypothetical protein